jgi:hypothetical protein
MSKYHLVPVAHEMTEAEHRRHLKKDLCEILKDPAPLSSIDRRRFHIRGGRGSDAGIRTMALLMVIEGLRGDLIRWLESAK